VTEKLAEVRRVLDRYLVEVVEAYDLCPWARSARTGGELAIDVVWGVPTLEEWIASARAQLAKPSTRVAMIVAPELAVTAGELRAIRDAVAARMPSAGIAEFHPDAAYDAATPARLVPFIRRSPDPLLQLVPLELLDRVRAYPAVVDLAAQAQILGGLAAPPRGDVADSIAANNHACVVANAARITAILEDIAADRRRSYASVGIAL
jgi:hypothetical protein